MLTVFTKRPLYSALNNAMGHLTAPFHSYIEHLCLCMHCR